MYSASPLCKRCDCSVLDEVHSDVGGFDGKSRTSNQAITGENGLASIELRVSDGRQKRTV